MHMDVDAYDVDAYRQELTANPAPEPPRRLSRVHALAGALLSTV